MEVYRVDRLSSLPNELLDHIFDLAHTYYEPLTGPLSHRLLPFFHRTVYREIRIESYNGLARLCMTAGLNPILLSHTRRLDIVVKMTPDETDVVIWREKPRPTERLLFDQAISMLFDQLVNLEELGLGGVNPVNEVIFFTQRSFPMHSTLRALDVTGVSESHFCEAKLPRFVHLTRLSWERRGYGAGSLAPQSSLDDHGPIFLPPRLEEFGLTGVLRDWAPTLENLSLPETVTCLALDDIGPISSLCSSLRLLVRHPEKLKQLTLFNSDDDAQTEADTRSCVDVLAQYPNLEALMAQGPWVPTTPAFYSALAQLPLKSLSFAIDTEISTRGLINFVKSCKIPCRIKLDNVDSVRGDMLPRDQGVEAVRDADLIGLGWNLPNCRR
ncbi:uncharacterized protein JCM6883_007625 [Sporobolomyces salmoneus]|uniref:uncharacterized protein n=1 Tax=Sporobolomyces salmoneus TaxID=183962 RepID=UPI00316CAAF2